MSETVAYAEFDAPPALRPFVKCVWRLTAPGPALDGVAEPIIPDGCVEIVLNCGDLMRRVHPDGHHEAQPRRLLAGQLTHAIVIGQSGRADLWGIRFHPWGAAAFLGVSTSELRDRMLSLDVLPEIDKVLARVHESGARDDAAAAQILFDALVERLPRARALDAGVVGVANLVADGREVSVRGIARVSGLSMRRVQRLFEDHIGMSPKSFMRLHRFQRALALARRHPAMSWGRIAVETGYYDHAHLVHDAQTIALCAPSDLVRQAGGITDAFIAE